MRLLHFISHYKAALAIERLLKLLYKERLEIARLFLLKAYYKIKKECPKASFLITSINVSLWLQKNNTHVAII